MKLLKIGSLGTFFKGNTGNAAAAIGPILIKSYLTFLEPEIMQSKAKPS